jgi:YVTN family beta-propeller protein
VRGTSISVRGLAAITAISVVFCVAAAGACAAPLAFVANKVSGNVQAIDTGTNRLSGKPIPVGVAPSSLAITPDGSHAYVTNSGANTVSVIDTASRSVVATIQVGSEPDGIAISPDGKSAFVTDHAGEEVSVIATGSNQVVHSIPLGFEPTAVAIAPDGMYGYVVGGEDSLAWIDAAGGGAATPVEVGKGPTNVAFSPDGQTAYVVDGQSGEVSVVDTGPTRVVASIQVGGEPNGIAVTPDGKRVFITDEANDAVVAVETQGDRIVGAPIPVGADPVEVAITPSGATAYVTSAASREVTTIDTATDQVAGAPVTVPGLAPSGIAITPDQSPVAAFTTPSATPLVPVTFSGAPSTDPDGTIAAYNWTFSGGSSSSGGATGISVSHTFPGPGAYPTLLWVVDNEGCSGAEVFTGRTAYCSGNPAAMVTHVVTVASPPVISNRFAIRRVIHNRRNGTVRLQVRLPDAGFVLLFGKKVHAVTRKSKGPQMMWLTIHARVELAKRLKKIHRARVRYRITFTPNGGTPRTAHRAVTLQRTPRHKQHRHRHRT